MINCDLLFIAQVPLTLDLLLKRVIMSVLNVLAIAISIENSDYKIDLTVQFYTV